jgi:GNAT superfamily N-acetyltransferase
MTDEYRIRQVEKPDDSMWSFIGGGLHHYNVQHGGDPHGGQVCFILYSPKGEIAGGLIGETHWGWFYINLLFVREELRGRGYGHRLLTMAEEEARTLGAKNAYLDTFTFQAPGFYEKHGYHVFGELKDFPPVHHRLYYTKQLELKGD